MNNLLVLLVYYFGNTINILMLCAVLTVTVNEVLLLIDYITLGLPLHRLQIVGKTAESTNSDFL